MIADGGFRVTNKDGVGVTQFCLEGTFSRSTTVSNPSMAHSVIRTPGQMDGRYIESARDLVLFGDDDH